MLVVGMVHMCTHACAGLSSSLFLYCSPFYFQAHLAIQQDSWGLSSLLLFYMDAEDSNAGLHAGLESTVVTQPHTHTLCTHVSVHCVSMF